jgi:hypothetical protein
MLKCQNVHKNKTLQNGYRRIFENNEVKIIFLTFLPKHQVKFK